MSTPTSPSRRRLLAAGLLLSTGVAFADDTPVLRTAGTLKVAVYNDLAPFSNHGQGIDADLGAALAGKLGLKLALLPFDAGDELGDDLRNMVWKGHYLGYGPADVMLHVPVDRMLMNANPQVEIFAPYYVETVRLVRSAQAIPQFDGVEALAGKRIGVEKVSISGMVMLGEGGGRFREQVHIYPTAIEALEQLKAGSLDAVLATRAQIESVMKGDPAFPLQDVPFDRLPRGGWAVGMAVKKDNVALARQLQAALNDLAASGELKTLFAKYGVQAVRP
ncbi:MULTISPECIES: substrate-binding periplasmic protein [Massilia]|jgi:ABC-type amino acid transport substrate-binding protein|uniref:Transporter substrate-binding domain-containing protein n=2 Tax=Massilia TaxID=149698 RepID=A0A7X3KAW8_9BURK|nr:MULTISPECIES: transporter substrate-binding domain-containing protein [Telluria group]KQY07740.1 amino acid ABC transporter substrate-binding protein [Massilia sp. Root133]KQZ38643.1 amino acid ABC transporter substrate-binding protein [Massilia sp. Root1485]MDN4046664.1 transporter substrate-binding domain-containing protein [Massilia sp. YIM B02787]MVW64489.1 transporter substrate-binding domain-containing protein [Telluria cellulosilytica]